MENVAVEIYLDRHGREIARSAPVELMLDRYKSLLLFDSRDEERLRSRLFGAACRLERHSDDVAVDGWRRDVDAARTARIDRERRLGDRLLLGWYDPRLIDFSGRRRREPASIESKRAAARDEIAAF